MKLECIFNSSHKVSSQIIEGRAGAGYNIMTVEKVINIQEEPGILVGLIGEVQVSEALVFKMFIRFTISGAVPKNIHIKCRCQFAACIVEAAVKLNAAIVIMPFIIVLGGLSFSG